MKKVYIGVGIAIIYAILYGSIIPYLISTKNDYVLAIGLVLLMTSILAPIHFCFNYFIKKDSK